MHYTWKEIHAKAAGKEAESSDADPDSSSTRQETSISLLKKCYSSREPTTGSKLERSIPGQHQRTTSTETETLQSTSGENAGVNTGKQTQWIKAKPGNDSWNQKNGRSTRRISRQAKLNELWRFPRRKKVSLLDNRTTSIRRFSKEDYNSGISDHDPSTEDN